MTDQLLITRLTTAFSRGLLLRFASLFILLLVIWLTVLFSIAIPGDPDLGWHYRYGEFTLENKATVVHDIFNHADWGQNAKSNAWLMEIIHVVLYQAGGFWGLIALSSVTVLLAYLLPLILIPGTSLGKLLAVPLAMFISWPVLMFGQRPQNMTILFVSAFFVILLLYRNRRIRWVAWTLPLLMLIWANVHGGHIAGMAMLGIFLVVEVGRWGLYRIGFRIPYLTTDPRLGGRQLIELSIITLLTMITEIIRPDGGLSQLAVFTVLGPIQHFIFPSEAAVAAEEASVTRVAILEWMPIAYHTLFGRIYIGSLVIMTFFLFLLRRRVTVTEVVVVVFFGYMATIARRHLPLFAVVSLPLLVAQFSAFRQVNLSRKSKTIALVSVGVLFILWLWPTTIDRMKTIAAAVRDEDTYFRTQNYPQDALLWVRAHGARLRVAHEITKRASPSAQTLPERVFKGTRNPDFDQPVPDVPLVFNFYDWGGYFIWQMPEYPVFMDGRIPGSPAFMIYQNVIGGDAKWQEVFDHFGVSWTFLPPNAPLIQLLDASPSWEEVYRDDRAVIHARRDIEQEIQEAKKEQEKQTATESAAVEEGH